MGGCYLWLGSNLGNDARADMAGLGSIGIKCLFFPLSFQ